MAMEWMEKDETFRRKVQNGLERFLTRKNDREAFGLAVKEPTKAAKVAPTASTRKAAESRPSV
jgi:hypothetical protein